MHPTLARQTLHADLGRSVEEVFAEFGDEPIAAASIGQVHRAVLHDGRVVAVKIQYPGAAKAIQDDLGSSELLATFFRFASSAAGATTPDVREATPGIAASPRNSTIATRRPTSPASVSFTGATPSSEFRRSFTRHRAIGC